jgi:hypothetical protein
VYSGSTQGFEYAQKFEKHDTIGCGLLIESKQIFYTINGRYLGVAFHDVDVTDLYPSVCLQS